MALPKVGIEAVVENANGYLKSIGKIVDANKEAADSVQDTAKDFDVLNDTTEYARSVQKRYSESLKAARSALDDTGGAANFFKEKIAAAAVAVDLSIGVFKAVGSAISFISGIIGDVIKNVVNLGKHIIDSGLDFSKIMANIQAVTKMSADETRALSNEIIQLGMDSVAGPKAVADAYYDIASGVQSAGAQMTILKLAIATAEAGQANLKDTTQGLVTAFNAYNMGLAEVTIASDVLTRTTDLGTKTMQEYVTAISGIAGQAASSRVKFDELGAAMAFLTTKGLTAGQASTALAGIMTQLARKTPGVTKALKAMGEQSIEGSIANNGLAGTLKLLQEGAAKTGQNLQQLVGRQEAMKAVTQLGTEEFKTFFKTFMEGLDEATSKSREIQRMDVNAQLQLVAARFEGISLLMAQTVLPSVAKFFKFINDSMAKLDWKKISAGLDKVAEALGKTVGALVEKLGAALEEVDWDQFAADVERVFTQVADFIGSIDWDAVIASIGAAIEGVKGFFANLGSQVEGTSNFVSQAFETVKGIFNAMFVIADGVGDILAAGIENGKAIVEGAVQHIKDGVNGIWMSLFGPEGSISTTVNEAWPKVVETVEGAVETVSGAIQSIVDAVKGIWDTLKATLETPVKDGLDAAKRIATDALNGITTAFASIGQAIASGLAAGIQAIAVLVSGIKELLGLQGQLPGAGGGGAGAGGVGIGAGSARGGLLKEGLNIVGERGAEAIIKHGKSATVISHEKTRGIMKRMDGVKPSTGASAANALASSIVDYNPGGGNVTPISPISIFRPPSSSSGGGGSPGGPARPPRPKINELIKKGLWASIMPIIFPKDVKAPAKSIARPNARSLSVGGGDTINNVTNRNIESVVFNTSGDAESAVEKFARLRASGKL